MTTSRVTTCGGGRVFVRELLQGDAVIQRDSIVRRVKRATLRANVIAVAMASIPAFMLGTFYLGPEPLTITEAREYFVSRFYVIAVIAIPYMICFVLINWFRLRNRIEHPLKVALLIAILDFAAVVVVYVAYVLVVLAPWHRM
jgi:Na+-driven multidrug efflux pump